MLRYAYRLVAVVPILFLALFAPSARAQANTGSDTVDVPHVMSAFHAAVVDHDGTRLAGLFAPTGSTWFNVLSDQRFASARATAADAPKIRVSSYRDFVGFISKSKASLDPRHFNLHIQSDGTIASVYFDFRFMIDGKEQNRGSETWQLVRGVDGWRIAAITFSSNLPPG